MQRCHRISTAFALGYQDQWMVRRVQLPSSVLLHMPCGRIVSCPHFIKCGCTFLTEIVKHFKFQTLCVCLNIYSSIRIWIYHELHGRNISCPHFIKCGDTLYVIVHLWWNAHILVQFFLNSFATSATYHGLYVTRGGSALFVLMHFQQFEKRQQLLYILIVLKLYFIQFQIQFFLRIRLQQTQLLVLQF